MAEDPSKSKTSTDQYGRKTWDVEAYTKREKIKEPTLAENYQLKESQTHLDHRQKLLAQSIGAVKTYNIVNPLNATTTSYGKNKRFGFACPVCDLSFRDNLTLIDHFNSPQHTAKISKNKDDINSAKSATLEQVVKTMEKLIAKLIRDKTKSDKPGLTFEQRVEKRKQFEEAKRKKRREKKSRKKMVDKIDNGDDNDEINKMLGFSGFGSIKK